MGMRTRWHKFGSIMQESGFKEGIFVKIVLVLTIKTKAEITEMAP